tara:strand:- start:437 stop:1012 length:576 start_codon:yes stop_codon:yes gene_type:complete
MASSSKIIVISGISGSGKTTLVRYLLDQKELNLVFSVSACSRKKRAVEADGEHYRFISQSDFEDRIKNNEFLEWEEVYPQHFYGTLKSSANKILDAGKNILFDVDVQGALSIKNYFKHKACTIFISPPSLDEVQKRLINRNTESFTDLTTRIQKMKQELTFGEKMDLQLLNDDLNIAKKAIYNYVKTFLKL